MATYACVKCGAATTRGSLIGYSDGTYIAVAFCELHKDTLKATYQKDGVLVVDASRAN